MRNVVIRQFVQHVISNAEYSALTCLSTASTAVLGLDAHDCVQYLLCHVTLVPAKWRAAKADGHVPGLASRDVCIGVQSKHLRCVQQWKVVNEFTTQLNGLALWDVVALVEVECF